MLIVDANSILNSAAQTADADAWNLFAFEEACVWKIPQMPVFASVIGDDYCVDNFSEIALNLSELYFPRISAYWVIHFWIPMSFESVYTLLKNVRYRSESS